MDLILNIKGLNDAEHWKKFQSKPNKLISKNSSEDTIINEYELNDNLKRSKYKEALNSIQSDFTEAQDQINILQIASETLNNISGSLNEIREIALESIDQLEGYKLTEGLKKKLENIEKLEQLQANFSKVLDKNDQNYTKALQEFDNVSNITLKIAKLQGFEDDINNNNKIESVINDINNSIMSVSQTKNTLDEVKSNIIIKIKSLNVTLENMVSSYSKIRNIELASKVVQLAQKQILNEASKSINVQITDNSVTVNQLIK